MIVVYTLLSLIISLFLFTWFVIEYSDGYKGEARKIGIFLLLSPLWPIIVPLLFTCSLVWLVRFVITGESTWDILEKK